MSIYQSILSGFFLAFLAGIFSVLFVQSAFKYLKSRYFIGRYM